MNVHTMVPIPGTGMSITLGILICPAVFLIVLVALAVVAFSYSRKPDEP
jgi:hypothetical protein